MYAAHPALLHLFLLDMLAATFVHQFRTGVRRYISPKPDGTWKQGNSSAARISATHSTLC